jgi:hypothetical protein
MSATSNVTQASSTVQKIRFINSIANRMLEEAYDFIRRNQLSEELKDLTNEELCSKFIEYCYKADRNGR